MLQPAAVAHITNGLYAVQVNNLQTKFATQYKAAAFANYTVAGQPAGLVKNSVSVSACIRCGV